MTFSTNLKAVATRLLTIYGRPVDLDRAEEGAYNPYTSETGTDTVTSYSGNGHPSPYSATEIAAGSVEVKDIQLLLQTDTLPLIGDVATIDDDVYRVMNVTRVSAQGEDIVYKLQLRI